VTVFAGDARWPVPITSRPLSLHAEMKSLVSALGRRRRGADHAPPVLITPHL
jgi:hypothetical protein